MIFILVMAMPRETTQGDIGHQKRFRNELWVSPMVLSHSYRWYITGGARVVGRCHMSCVAKRPPMSSIERS